MCNRTIKNHPPKNDGLIGYDGVEKAGLNEWMSLYASS